MGPHCSPNCTRTVDRLVAVIENTTLSPGDTVVALALIVTFTLASPLAARGNGGP
ncbi:MAG: TetR/AcrR family transcriptional regulator C-terminal domain-containing protein [Gemmatimonas sp.]